jgi:hypothetical protein
MIHIFKTDLNLREAYELQITNKGFPCKPDGGRQWTPQKPVQPIFSRRNSDGNKWESSVNK